MAARLGELKKALTKTDAAPNYISDIHIVKRPNGKVNHYAWRGPPLGPALPGEPGSEESIAAWREHIAKRDAPSDGMTLRDLLALYKASAKWTTPGLMSNSTKSNYLTWFARIDAKWGSEPLAAFAEEECRGFILAWRDTYAAQPRSADAAIATFSALLSFAVERRLTLTRNHLFETQKLYKSNRNLLIWRPQDLAVLEASAPPEVFEVAKLASLCGWRLGDLLKLLWADFEGITAEVDTNKSGGRTQANLVRYAALDAFLKVLEARPPRFDRYHRPLPKAATVLVTAKGGKPWRSFGKSWQTAKKAASTTITDPTHKAYFDSLHFHDLRGTAVTEMAGAGLTVAEIAWLVGWDEESVNAIIKRYVNRDLVAQRIKERLENRGVAAPDCNAPEPLSPANDPVPVTTIVTNPPFSATGV